MLRCKVPLPKKVESKFSDCPNYDPKVVEKSWQEWWYQRGYFTPNASRVTRDRFSMVIPPPNVTGELHLGHTLTIAIQDSLTRWHRMNGRTALWVPGADHAGIATQVVVEKKLMREQQKTRHDLGRHDFINLVWKWKQQFHDRINSQTNRLGASVDWSRECFTMDPKLTLAVNAAFIRLFNEGLIYRESRIVNWCYALKTAISDIELDYVEVEKRTKLTLPQKFVDPKTGKVRDSTVDIGVLYKFAYKLEDTDDEIIVATTRPETMLADTAIAVNSQDPRYFNFHGKKVKHPFTGNLIPIICDDELVDKEFGTGAVKVSPAHDINDWNCAKRHNLPVLDIFDDEGHLRNNCAQFSGMNRIAARVAVVKALDELGLMRGQSDHPMSVAICSRSKDIIEPRIKPQWWVSCGSMAQKAIQVARTGQLTFHPPNYTDTWYRWLGDIRDWCISRQLWWGHRIPVYLIKVKDPNTGQFVPLDDASTSNWVAASSEAEALDIAQKKLKNIKPEDIQVKQDDDVLDTWFSSALFPFSVFGWPNITNNEEYEKFYPTSLLETGHDILFFWVARMVMMGLHLTGKVPFSQVYLHAMVRDAHGRKMSKSLGNALNPMDVITGKTLEDLNKGLREGNLDPKELDKAVAAQSNFPNGIPECGADATRFGLVAYTMQGRDINMDINRIVSYRYFCNKIWNATKFGTLFLNIADPDVFVPAESQPTNVRGYSNWDRWILHKLNECIIEVNESFKNLEFSKATTAVYSFWLYELCDVYLESIKPLLKQTNPQLKEQQTMAREVFYTCIDNGLRLLHPFMPFVTEDLFQRLPRRKSDEELESITIARFPTEVPSWKDPEMDAEITNVQNIIKSLRQMKANFMMSQHKPQVFINVKTAELKTQLEQYQGVISFLSSVGEVSILVNHPQPPAGCAVEILNDKYHLFMMVKGLVNINEEIAKLDKKQAKLEGDLQRLKDLMAGENYHRLPQNLRDDNNTKLGNLNAELDTVKHTKSQLAQFI